MVDPDGPTPVYVQIADIIQQRIEAGELRPNRPIPSELAIQQEFGVARGTARRAVELLRDRGLVFTVPQRGSFVASGSERNAPNSPDGRTLRDDQNEAQ
ncbi:winged helix-turn-helix transcriptional regulator [Dactylosporangium aurantiacum]|uniref:Winged helix-turn-helix transcriptional regulator n=2 Tax=Dactylosporangium aurantiacum TaxID=35754 RepID=A0A9Q9INF6_9ACTN|nr:winged helix-turn-helix domain-containing protein [Dactylosporangium aurantiacum]MDG6106122.1 winged helix-turn-helix domain-containing protein [Dactylosporangium aurantiacum]UWZ59399.1 winged helix-turn-helix transcriptional regulator [Dactylosporangium aurantiacum]